MEQLNYRIVSNLNCVLLSLVLYVPDSVSCIPTDKLQYTLELLNSFCSLLFERIGSLIFWTSLWSTWTRKNKDKLIHKKYLVTEILKFQFKYSKESRYQLNWLGNEISKLQINKRRIERKIFLTLFRNQ